MNKRKGTIQRWKKTVYRHGRHPCKSKTKRLKEKREIRRNRNLLRKYPWLRAVDWNWNPIDTDEFTVLDDMPRGWRKCFGMLLVKDIDKALKGREFHSEELKEKFGALRWYFSASEDVYKDVSAVIDAYSIISENVCIGCGQPDVGATIHGWIEPICPKCFAELQWTIPYNEAVSPRNRMALEHRFRRYDPIIDKWKDYTVDISEYTNKVRLHWYNNRN